MAALHVSPLEKTAEQKGKLVFEDEASSRKTRLFTALGRG
jgi:hypothetical protein